MKWHHWVWKRACGATLALGTVMEIGERERPLAGWTVLRREEMLTVLDGYASRLRTAYAGETVIVV